MESKKLGLGVKEWVICPPCPSAGGEGPEDDVKEIFFEYLEALHQENLHHTKKGAKSAADLLIELLSFSHDYEDIPADAQAANAEIIDLTQLDANIRKDPAIIDLLSHADLHAIATNHNIKFGEEGVGNTDIKHALRAFYAET